MDLLKNIKKSDFLKCFDGFYSSWTIYDMSESSRDKNRHAPAFEYY